MDTAVCETVGLVGLFVVGMAVVSAVEGDVAGGEEGGLDGMESIR